MCELEKWKKQVIGSQQCKWGGACEWERQGQTQFAPLALLVWSRVSKEIHTVSSIISQAMNNSMRILNPGYLIPEIFQGVMLCQSLHPSLPPSLCCATWTVGFFSFFSEQTQYNLVLHDLTGLFVLLQQPVRLKHRFWFLQMFDFQIVQGICLAILACMLFVNYVLHLWF